MIPLTLADIAAITDGQVHGDPGLVVDAPAYVDSRRPVPGGLFVAVAGERVDGHEYAAGAHAVLGTRPTAAPTVVTADATVAAGRLARRVSDRLRDGGTALVALTGSQGKTSTKDLLAHVLATAGGVDGRGAPTVATAANNNNELGVPLTVLRAQPSTRHLVVEMGARGIGHIAYLCTLAPPRVAAVLNVGTAHVGEFGSREAIAVAKGEIVEALPGAADGGVAVLNADDPLVAAMAPRTTARVLTFGLAGEVTWRGVELDDHGRAGFELGHDDTWAPVRLRQIGAHHVANAAAAAAMALAAGLELAAVAAALSTAESASRWRMEPRERADGLLVLNDAYNANPDSMAAALDALVAVGRRRTGRTVAVLGEMLELGPDAEAAHREVGRRAALAGVDEVVTVGPGAEAIADGARAAAAGGPTSSVVVTVTAGRAEALAHVRENARAGDAVLVKASRGGALEHVATGLLEPEEGTSAP